MPYVKTVMLTVQFTQDKILLRTRLSQISSYLFCSGQVFLILTFTGWRYWSGRPIMNESGIGLFLVSSPYTFIFFDNQQININIKISNFFHLNEQTYVFIYLNRRIVKYINFNFKILIFRPLIPLVHSFLTHSSISNFSEVLWSNWLKY